LKQKEEDEKDLLKKIEEEERNLMYNADCGIGHGLPQDELGST